jgi:hypothetical protein
MWDGQELILTFRRNVHEALMSMRWELCSLIEGTSLTDEEIKFCGVIPHMHWRSYVGAIVGHGPPPCLRDFAEAPVPA